MNARQARARRAEQRAKVLAALADANGKLPVYVGDVGPAEAWKVGGVLAVIPPLRDDYPPAIKSAVDRRRRATLTGRCDCGATRRVTSAGRIEMAHEPDCVASDQMLDQVAAQHGLAFARWPS